MMEYTVFSGYVQIPLEVRILNYILQRVPSSEEISPKNIVYNWVKEVNKPRATDFIMMHLVSLTIYLLEKPLFIQMIETLRGLARKVRSYYETETDIEPSMTENEKAVLEYMLITYLSISPINSILQGFIAISSPDLYNQARETLKSHFPGNELKESFTGVEIIVEYLFRMISGPYIHEGSSLAVAVRSMQMVELRYVWSDIVSSDA
jgi:hypothetical protein